jgi:hypothetical protein
MKLLLKLSRFISRILSRREPEVPAGRGLWIAEESSEHMFLSGVVAPGDQFQVVALRLRHADEDGRSNAS